MDCKNEENVKGSLSLIIGPMYSSKSVSLNNALTQMADIGLNVLKIIHTDDVRKLNDDSDKSGSTHSSTYKTLTEKITCVKSSNLKNINVEIYDVIGIDEGQFFDDLLETVENWIEKMGKHVKVAGLDGDFQKKKFGQILDLIPLADDVVKLSSKCQICIENNKKKGIPGRVSFITINSAPFTKRLTKSLNQKEVGGKDKYIPVCRFHHDN